MPNFLDKTLGILDKQYLPYGDRSVLAKSYAPGPGILFSIIFYLLNPYLKLFVQLFLNFDKKYKPFSFIENVIGSTLKYIYMNLDPGLSSYRYLRDSFFLS